MYCNVLIWLLCGSDFYFFPFLSFPPSLPPFLPFKNPGCFVDRAPGLRVPSSAVYTVLSHSSCLTLCNPVDCSPAGSSVHGTLQAGGVVWVAMPSSRGSCQPRDGTQASRIVGVPFSVWATGEELPRVLKHHSLTDGDGREGGVGMSCFSLACFLLLSSVFSMYLIFSQKQCFLRWPFLASLISSPFAVASALVTPAPRPVFTTLAC